MDARGNIYEVTPDILDTLNGKTQEELKEDQARLDGYLRGRAEAVKLGEKGPEGEDRHSGLEGAPGPPELFAWHSQVQGTYRKADQKGEIMGIDGVEELAGGDAEFAEDPLEQFEEGPTGEPTTAEDRPGDDQGDPGDENPEIPEDDVDRDAT